jgi:predicted nucleotidyltransferase
MPPESPLDVARRVAAAFARLPEVRGVALAGSRSTGAAGPDSDVDLYVYASPEPALDVRRAITSASPRAEVGNRFFEPGDEWIDPASGVHVDAMYRDPRWIEADLHRVLLRHEAWVGYSTAFWHSVRSAIVLFDRDGWLAALKARADAPYPEPLRRAIVAKNLPLLRANLSSYRHQLERALARGDAPAVNHRIAAFLASLFDVLFAVNRLPHPGEKRLLDAARACPRRPEALEEDVRGLVAAGAAGSAEALVRADALAGGLEDLARAEGLIDPA